jgi:predicted nucleic acid-binding protein
VSAVYLDTSVLGRVLLNESDTQAIRRELGHFELHVSSRLMSVELYRVGLREDLVEDVERLLSGKVLIPIDEEILGSAETINPSMVRTLDAIHLATAIRLANAEQLDTLMTYDKQLASGAREHGLEVLSPS